VRGHLKEIMDKDEQERSIPACAGPPLLRAGVRSRHEVYPRVCGATSDHAASWVNLQGLSPRVRGHRPPTPHRNPFLRSIPACAGPPRGWERLPVCRQVYPRVCGATEEPVVPRATHKGLSPRVRGHPEHAALLAADRRSIPACAGPPTSSSSSDETPRVYPRVCGATRRP